MDKIIKILALIVVGVMFASVIPAWFFELVENWDKGSMILISLPILAIGMSLLGILFIAHLIGNTYRDSW